MGPGGVPVDRLPLEINVAPNILTILPDDMGCEMLSVYGRALAGTYSFTPNITRLAQNGVRFNRAYSQPWCSPTRAAMMTGSWGFQTGIGSLAEGTNQPLLDPEVCLPAAVKYATSNGYACAEIGKHHLADFQTVGGDLEHPIRMGFDYWTGTKRNTENGEDYYSWNENTAERVAGGIKVTEKHINEYLMERLVAQAVGWIGRQAYNPWWCHFTCHLPHAPYNKPPSYAYTGDWDMPDVAPPDGSSIAVQREYYKAMIEALDYYIGKLFDGIRPDVLANTVVILWSDNGTPGSTVNEKNGDGTNTNPNHAKRSVYELGCNVPLIVSGPGVASPGRSSEAIVCAVDLFATVIEIAGGNPAGVPVNPAHGRPSLSFVQVINGTSTTHRNYAYLDLFGPNRPHLPSSGSNTMSGSRALSGARYKILKNSGTNVTFPDAAAPFAVDATCEMYDLQTDPYEALNLLGTSSPFYSGGNITLTDVNPTYPGLKTEYQAMRSYLTTLTGTFS